MNTSDRASEASKVAELAIAQLPGQDITFTLEPQFQGREMEIMEGANNILKAEREDHIVLTVAGPGCIHIQA